MNSKLRIVLLWFASLLVVIAIFVLSTSLSQRPEIILTPDHNILDYMPEVNQTYDNNSASPIEGTEIIDVVDAEYTTRDDETKEIIQIFGFKSVLKSQGDQWELEKPYIDLFRKQFNCSIRAEKGIVRVEQSSAQVDPREGQLQGNVTITLKPKKENDQNSDAVIYLDDLTFTSEESRFFTDGPVEFISDELHIVGKGLQGIYNEQSNRIELFRITTLTKPLKLMGRAAALFASNEKEQTKTPPSDLPPKTPSAEPTPAPDPVKPKPIAAEPPPEARPVLDPNQDKYYKCLFSQNVVIDSPDQFVFAQKHISFSNILWKNPEDTEEQPEPPKPQTNTTTTTDQNTAPPQAPVPADTPIAKKVTTPQPQSKQSEPLDTPAEILITCDNGILITPMDSDLSIEDFRTPDSNNTSASVSPEDTKQRPALYANTINYSTDTGQALATGPLRVVFYPNDVTTADPNQELTEPLPITVTAKKLAKFLPESNLVLFEGDCLATMTKPGPNSTEDYQLAAPTLEIKLIPDSNDIERFTARGQRVSLSTTKTENGKKVSVTELNCKSLDHYILQQTFLASGPGVIKILNSKEPDPNDDKPGFNLNKPSLTVISNFDNLHYAMSENIITANRDPNTPLLIQYLPIIDGKIDYDQKTSATAENIEAKLVRLPDDQLELESFTATGTITYEDLDKYFEGGLLHYDLTNSRVIVHSDGINPCILNGMAVDNIEWDIKTDKIKANVVAPGAIK